MDEERALVAREAGDRLLVLVQGVTAPHWTSYRSARRSELREARSRGFGVVSGQTSADSSEFAPGHVVG